MFASNTVEIFDVVLGYPPEQKIFTVPRDLLVRRSEFFKTVRSTRWLWENRQPFLKPVDLSDEYPDTFTSYLHCVFFDSVAPNARMEGNIQRYDDLIELYTLAEQLLDFTTADLVIDKIISSVDEMLLLPGVDDIKLVYATTVDGSPLRRLMVDYCVYSEVRCLPRAKDEYPHEYLQEVVEKFMALKGEPIQEVYRPDPEDTSEYHRDAHADLMDKLSFALQF